MTSRIGFKLLSAASVLGLAAQAAISAPIAPGDLVIYRVGDGAAALAGTAAAVFIDEYTPTGTLVQSVALPGSGGSAADLTAVGTSGTEGVLNIGADGSIDFTGYRADAGAAISTTVATAQPRVIGTLNPLTGAFDTSVATTATGVGTASIRSAVKASNGGFYVGSSSATAGVAFIAAPSGTSAISSIDARNTRQVELLGDTLYASNGSTAIAPKVQNYGTLPTTTTVPTAIFSPASNSDAVQGFYFADENPLVAGVDTLYALDTVASTLNKLTYNGTTWSTVGTLSSSATNLTGLTVGTTTTLYLTTGSTLSTLVDATGTAGALTGLTFASLSTAATNTAFRGVAIVVPEPASLGLLALGGLALARRRKA